MFWNTFVELCSKNKVSPNAVCKELGFSNATATKWKNGSEPRDTTCNKIADYFGVSVDYLLGKSYSEHEEVTQQEKELLKMLKQLNEDDLKTALRIVQRLAEKK